MRQIAAVLLIILSIFSFKSGNYSEVEINQINNLTEDNLTIIRMQIDGVDYSFLYDTAADHSILDTMTFVKNNLDSFTNVNDETYTVLMDSRFIISDFHKTKDNVKFHTGEDIDGVINADIVYKNTTLNLSKTKIKQSN